ncbi:MAG: hypothetical protein ACREJM_14110, partial [Candidatus Saccharimonadales bacterium]
MATGPKPKLPMARLPYYRVHYLALEQYVAKVYRVQDFNFLLAAGVTAGEQVDYKVDGLLPTDELKRRADEIRAGRRTRNVALLLSV